ncbi:hypothetical protein CLU79DRAFT_722510 [Phycomyces nitens]|nr:hypothetical protein CLU79DRAFT_722510 [Phycomyces nitens]
MESDYGFDEYIMPTTYAGVPKLECYNTQLYPSVGYYGNDTVVFENNAMPQVMPSSMLYPQPSSPDSVYSRLSPGAPSPLMSCSPPAAVPLVSNLAHAITQKIAKANTLPESFLPEFHQYSKETYENGGSKKRRRVQKQQQQVQQQQQQQSSSSSSCDFESSSSDQEDDIDSVSAAEVRRQIHIQSEQKRRAQIKDGFDELRQHLPGCVNKKMSKAALLHRTTQHLQHLKNNQTSLLAELERLMNENEQLRKFQDSVLQKQALERMYQMGAM